MYPHHLCHIILITQDVFSLVQTTLVNKSAGLSSDLMCPVNDPHFATDSWMAWEAIASSWVLTLTWGVIENWHVISINIWGSRYWNAHHPQLMSGGFQGFHSDFHGNKLCTKDQCFFVDCFLEYQLINDMFINHEPSPRSHSLFLASLVSGHFLSSWE